MVHRGVVQPGDLDKQTDDKYVGTGQDTPAGTPGLQQCWTPGTTDPPGRDRSGVC